MGKSKDTKISTKATKAEAPIVSKKSTKETAPAKKEKKSKKAPTPSESSDSESGSEESSSSSSESEAEVETKKPVKAAKKEESSSEASSSDSSDSEEETVPAKAVKAAKATVNAAAKIVAKATESGSDSDSDSSESEEAEEKKSESGSDSSDSDSSDSEEAAPSKKRKADDEEETSAKKVKSDAVEDTGSKNLFVGNLSWNVDDEWLYREFEEFGEITGARVISDRDSGRSKGFGYVEFANSADAAKALAAKKGALIDGREANVDFSTPRDNAAPKDRANARAATYGDQKNPESDTLFVGNISFEANEDIIGEAFGTHGSVVNVRLPTDMDSGNPKGFGYVTFASVEDAKNAMENMMGADIAGRPVRLDYATPRPERDAGGGRGGGRGGRGGFGDRGGRGGGRGGRGGFGDRGGRGGSRGGSRGGRGGSTNRGGFGDFQGKKQTF